MKGSLLRDAMISGANQITNYKQSVDELNVFPVPDGDTGTNMSMTVGAAVKELSQLKDDVPVGRVAEVAASALLRGARGNSGVITSLLFRGFAKGLKGKAEADGADLAQALDMGVQAAYKAVMKPTEGTILTVARLAAEKAVARSEKEKDPAVIFETMLTAAREALAQTPELLPVLKKAGVVDAGGQGFVRIMEGMYSVIHDGKMIEAEVSAKKAPVQPMGAAASYEGEIHFTYCTEYIVQKKPDAADPLKLRAFLESIGDCVVVVDDAEIIKVHVHSNDPGLAIQEGIKFGFLDNIKVENMREQHEHQAYDAQQVSKSSTYQPVDENTPFGFVAVAAGEGVQALFADLGVNNLVTGGQTMNPSTEDILEAIHATPARTVFVLPNNKNIIMAAEQAIPLADRKVCVLQTRTIPQGIAAMLAFDPSADFEENQVGMTKALDHVSSGQITFAARDSDYDGYQIKEGEILAMDNGKLAFVEKDLKKALQRLVKRMLRFDSSFVTVLYGENVSDEEAREAEAMLQEKFGQHVEISMVNGGQPVYYYMISVE